MKQREEVKKLMADKRSRAVAHHTNSVMKFFGLMPLKRHISELKEQDKESANLYILNLKKRFFKLYLARIEAKKAEQVKAAILVHTTSISKFVINQFKNVNY